MSSLAATQADGYYVPVEYYESGAYKKQSKNQFNSSSSSNGRSGGGGQGHGHNQWLQNGVVRFELPHRGRCLGPSCTQLAVGQGTRYNARKVKTGEYYFTTPIVEFHLKCRSCGHPWIIRTNPAGRCFDFVEGIKKHDEENISMMGSAAQCPDDGDTHDPLQRLETAVHGKDRAVRELEELQQLKKLNDEVGYDDAIHNANVRRAFRKDRKQKRRQLADASKLGWRPGMKVLAPTAISIDDVVEWKETVFGSGRETERRRMSKVRQSSIFDTASSRSKKASKKRKGWERKGSISERPDHTPSSLASISTTTTAAQKLCHSSTNGIGCAGESSRGLTNSRKRRKISIVGKNDINSTPCVDKEAEVEEGRPPASAQESKSLEEEPRELSQGKDKTTTTTGINRTSSSSINDLLAGYGTSESDDGE